MELEPEAEPQESSCAGRLSADELARLKAEEAAILAELASLGVTSTVGSSRTEDPPNVAATVADENRARRLATLGNTDSMADRPVDILRQRLVELLGNEAVAMTASTSFSLHDDACLARYLTARKGDIAAAAQMLQDTLQWRAEFGVDTLARDCWQMIQTEAADGKVFVGGFDNDGRPIIVLRSANEKTFDNKGKKCGNLVNLVYNIERAVASIETRRGSVPDDKWTLLLDFNGYSLFNAPPFETTKWTIKIVQDFYPERLHVAIMVDAPTLFWGAWKAASPFIDEVTKSKVVWISGPLESQERLDALREYVPLDQIDRSIGGSQPESLDYNAERYLAADPLRRTRTAT